MPNLPYLSLSTASLVCQIINHVHSFVSTQPPRTLRPSPCSGLPFRAFTEILVFARTPHITRSSYHPRVPILISHLAQHRHRRSRHQFNRSITQQARPGSASTTPTYPIYDERQPKAKRVPPFGVYRIANGVTDSDEDIAPSSLHAALTSAPESILPYHSHASQRG